MTVVVPPMLSILSAILLIERGVCRKFWRLVGLVDLLFCCAQSDRIQSISSRCTITNVVLRALTTDDIAFNNSTDASSKYSADRITVFPAASPRSVSARMFSYSLWSMYFGYWWIKLDFFHGVMIVSNV